MVSLRDSASRTSSVSSPGTEKTYSQPSASRHSTSRSAAVRVRAVIATAESVRSPAEEIGSGGGLDRPQHLAPTVEVGRDQVLDIRPLRGEGPGRSAQEVPR